MGKKNSKQQESKKKTLQDGRRFWTTGNGFTYWVQANNKAKTVTEIDYAYYLKILQRWKIETAKNNRK